MQTATSETESKSRDLSICVHHYTLRAPCPKGQGISIRSFSVMERWSLLFTVLLFSKVTCGTSIVVAPKSGESRPNKEALFCV